MGNNMNKYEKWYSSIIENAQARNGVNGYSEVHHILPKSMGGTNDRENLVELTAREHFIAHWLLVKIHKDGEEHWKMLNALRMMRAENSSHKRYESKITARVYENLKEEYAKLQSMRYTGAGNGMYGKTHSDEAKEKLRIANTGKTLTEEQRRKVGESKLGKKREKFNDEWMAKLKEANTGESNPMHGKIHSDETREKMREKAMGRKYSAETIAKRVEKQKGQVRPKIQCPHCSQMIAVNTFPRWHGDKCKMNTVKITDK
jgi:NUMOD3 motif